jgi:hypothetical protein
MCSGEATRKSGSEATLNDRGSGTAVAYDSLKKSGQEARALAQCPQVWAWKRKLFRLLGYQRRLHNSSNVMGSFVDSW